MPWRRVPGRHQVFGPRGIRGSRYARRWYTTGMSKPGPPVRSQPGPPTDGNPCPACNEHAGSVPCWGAGVVGQWPPGSTDPYHRVLGPCPHGKTRLNPCLLCVYCIQLQEEGCPIDMLKLAPVDEDGFPPSIQQRERAARGIPNGRW